MANLGYIQLTRICNQNCLFCSNPENQNIISLDDAKSQLLELKNKNYDGVILTGGEPTLHKRLKDIIALSVKLGIIPRIITNGQVTSKSGYLKSLQDAGLDHIHISIHSMRDNVQSYLTQNPESLKNLKKTLDEAARIQITVDINTVICAQNSDHLDETVKIIVDRWPFVKHFVWNNMDTKMNRVKESPQTVPNLSDLELSLFRAMSFLEKTGRTFRVERLALCYMADFPWASTETRKIVKGEERIVNFLDEKGKVNQSEFVHEKSKVCSSCSLDSICAGLYDSGGAYDPRELYPIFLDTAPIIKKIKKQPKK